MPTYTRTSKIEEIDEGLGVVLQFEVSTVVPAEL